MDSSNFKDIEIPDSYIDSFDKESFFHLGLFRMPPGFGNPLFGMSKQRGLEKGFDYSFSVEKVWKAISKVYDLESWQLKHETVDCYTMIALIVPHSPDDEPTLIEDMLSLGYSKNNSWFIEKKGIVFSVIEFKANYQETSLPNANSSVK